MQRQRDNAQMTPTHADLYDFMRRHRLCTISTISEDAGPESALVYFAVTPKLELIFYTIQTTRKVMNLRHDPRVAAVIGWDAEQTLQYRGVADEPEFEELDEFKRIFLEMLPDRVGRLGWPGLTFFRVSPRWIRFSNYDDPWQVNEIVFPEPDSGGRKLKSIWRQLNSLVTFVRG